MKNFFFDESGFDELVLYRILDRVGFVGRPTWEELLAGARPLPPEVADPGDWQYGWQYYASSASEHHFRENVALAQSHANQAHLRSHSGPGAGASSAS